tara:strand:+ start:28480 stop:29586 length:1107 start_codon:yes stop_codon:yes gene_type:complete
MEDLQLALTTNRVDQKNYGLWLKSWQVGQVLQALVTDKMPSGDLVLRIGAQQVTATTDIPVQKGAVLTLEVKSVTPVPLLTVRSSTETLAGQVDPLRAQLQMLLSRQGKVTDPLTTLMDPARSAKILALLGVGRGATVELIKHAALFEQLSDPRQLREAVNRSGLFLEPRLLQLALSGETELAPDLKADLLRLREQLDQALLASLNKKGLMNEPLRAFREQVDGALATISLHQLAAHGPGERSNAIWLVHLPFQTQDTAHCLSLSISRNSSQGKADEETEDDWKVLLDVSLPNLGTIEAELYLRSNKLSVVMSSEIEATARLMQEHLSGLRTALESRGMEVGVLRSNQGSRNVDQPQSRLHQYLDELA